MFEMLSKFNTIYIYIYLYDIRRFFNYTKFAS